MKTVTINGKAALIETDDLSYMEIVYMAGFDPFSSILYTVTFCGAPGTPDGTVVPGKKMWVGDGTALNVVNTPPPDLF